MADPPTILQEAAKYGGTFVGGGGFLLLVAKLGGGLIQGWISGTPGMEKEIREDLRIEVQRLAKDLAAARDEIDELRLQGRYLNFQYVKLITERETARAKVNQLEREASKPETVWPPDAPPPAATP